jgi:hypothetical protein
MLVSAASRSWPEDGSCVGVLDLLVVVIRPDQRHPPRLSRVIGRLERDGYVQRTPYEQDRRVTNATLTAAGWEKVVHAAPGHVATVRTLVIDALSSAQVAELSTICARLLSTIDPSGRTFVTPGVSSTSAPGLGLNLTGKPRCR